MQFRTREGPQRYAALVADPARSVVCLDFDGVLAPIVDDPARAFIHPEAHEVLFGVLRAFRAVAVVTGRPAEQAVYLGGLETLADHLADHLTGTDATLVVLGQYGNERWDSHERTTRRPDPPAGLADLRAELPDLLAAAGAGSAFVEDKGLAVAVHTRRLPDPAPTLERLVEVLEPVAERLGLVLEPGRLVVEVRGPGMHKGHAVHRVQQELDPHALLFAGDDLGDVAAFEAVRALRATGTAGLLVCSGSTEQQALVELADLVVEGPDGVMALLRRLAADAARR